MDFILVFLLIVVGIASAAAFVARYVMYKYGLGSASNWWHYIYWHPWRRWVIGIVIGFIVLLLIMIVLARVATR